MIGFLYFLSTHFLLFLQKYDNFSSPDSVKKPLLHVTTHLRDKYKIFLHVRIGNFVLIEKKLTLITYSEELQTIAEFMGAGNISHVESRCKFDQNNNIKKL